MKMQSKISTIVLSGILLVGLFAGCGRESVRGAVQTKNGDEQAEQEDSGEEMILWEKEKTIYVIVKVLDDPYWSVLQAGAVQAGKDFGCDVIIVGTSAEDDIEGQVSLLRNAVLAQADGIVIAPLDSVSLDRPITETYNAFIPVVLVDTVINSENYSAAYLTDQVEAGRSAAAELLSEMKKSDISEKEEAQVAIQISSADSLIISERVKGFREYWDANAPEAWIVLKDDIKVNEGDSAKAVECCLDFLMMYPDLKAVFGPDNGSSIGFVTGLTEENRTDIIMVGFDFSAELETMIRSGQYNAASVVQRQYLMGYEGVKTALDLANSGKVEEKNVDTGVLLIDRFNVDSEEVQGTIHP